MKPTPDSVLYDVLGFRTPKWCETKGMCGCIGCVNKMPYYKRLITEKLGRMVTREEYFKWKEGLDS